MASEGKVSGLDEGPGEGRLGKPDLEGAEPRPLADAVLHPHLLPQEGLEEGGVVGTDDGAVAPHQLLQDAVILCYSVSIAALGILGVAPALVQEPRQDLD